MAIKIKKGILFLSVFTLLGMIFLAPVALVSASEGSTKVKGNEYLSEVWTKTEISSPSSGFGIDMSGNKLYAVGSVLNPIGMKFEALMVAYNTKGDLLWSKSLGGENNFSALAVAVKGKSVYMVGNTFNNDPSMPDKALFAKYTTDGKLEWSATWNSGISDAATSVVAVDNAVYVAGYSFNLSQMKTDIFLKKFDTNGNALWTASWGGEYNDAPSSIAVDGDKIFVVGGTMGEYGQTDAFLLKYKDDGELKQSTTWGSGYYYDAASGVAVAGDMIYVSGVALTDGGDLDAILRAYNQKLELKWDATWGEDGDDAATNLAVGNTGDIYVVGDTAPSGIFDAFLLKYDKDGTFKASTTWGGAGNDFANSVKAGNGVAYVIGVSNYGTMSSSLVINSFQVENK